MNIYFNPRSPWGERLLQTLIAVSNTRFQSTLPVGGATSKDVRHVSKVTFQSTLPVGGATVHRHGARPGGIISIHAPRGGSDLARHLTTDKHPDFNPRSPWGERHLVDPFGVTGIRISIHAPRVGSDSRA